MTIGQLPFPAIVLALSLGPQTLFAQGTPLPPQGSPPVLSSVPDLPAGATPEPGQMSGVPLQVGDLPPGIIVVRVIRQSFQNNVAGQTVRLRVGDGARMLTSETGTDGRAQFDGLTVGESIQVRAAVGGENLESQQFPVPAQGGVRLVLVAGVGAPTAAGPDWTDAPAPAGAPPSEPAAGTPTRTTSAPVSTVGTNAWLAGLIGGAFLVAGLTLRGRRSRAASSRHGGDRTPSPRLYDEPATPPGPPPREDWPDHRAATFERLVRLAKDHEAGRVSDAEHAAARGALIDELAEMDSARL